MVVEDTQSSTQETHNAQVSVESKALMTAVIISEEEE